MRDLLVIGACSGSPPITSIILLCKNDLSFGMLYYQLHLMYALAKMGKKILERCQSAARPVACKGGGEVEGVIMQLCMMTSFTSCSGGGGGIVPLAPQLHSWGSEAQQERHHHELLSAMWYVASCYKLFCMSTWNHLFLFGRPATHANGQ